MFRYATRLAARAAVPLLAAMTAFAFTPSSALACACGCGVFEVGGGNHFAEGRGTTLSLEDDHLEQSRNWSGSSRAPADDNEDKLIRSNFLTLGVQHMFDRKWGIMADLPVVTRTLTSEETPGDLESVTHTGLGDLRVTGVYTGLSDDMSTGLIVGAKLPTGDWKAAGLDRDTGLGTGSTDLLLGAYHQGSVGVAGWFAQVMWDQPLAYQGGYRPGAELNAAVGVYAPGWKVAERLKLVPLIQAVASVRARDHGPEGDPDNTGYDRLVLSPGLELEGRGWRLYGDVEFPVYQRVNGDQLVAPHMVKVAVSRSF